jgi:hypothetical protein
VNVTTPSLQKGFCGGRAHCILLLIAALSLLPLRTRAQENPLDEYTVKAALLFNIAKYTDWPPRAFSDSDEPIVIGVLGDDPFGSTLDRIVEGRSINGRPIVIRRASGIAPLEGAHLIFVSASQPQAPQDCTALERAGILTVGDTPFTADYAAVSISLDGDKVAFTVDLERSRRIGASISSQLLKFAKSVKRADSTSEQ